jgi:cytochrome P450
VADQPADLAALVRLEDPRFYENDVDAVYRRLRDEDPVFYYPPLDLFVVSRYADIRDVAARPREFSSASGLLLTEYRHALTASSSFIDDFFDPKARFLEFADPPEHRPLRNLLAPWFQPKAVADRRRRLADHCARLVTGISAGQPVEFVSAVAARLPVLVVCDLLGIADIDFGQALAWSDALESLSAETRPAESRKQSADAFGTLRDFLLAEFGRRRGAGSDDLIGGLLGQSLDGQPISDEMAFVYVSALLASNDTSRSLLAGLMIALAEHPDQLQRLARDPGLAGAAVDEGLRWVTPARGFGRTAVADAEIAGRRIRAGQRVYMLFAAGNRDPRAFPDPTRFDITRPDPLPHLSFGVGPHICLAAQLVRAETIALLHELFARFSAVSIVDEPVPVRGILRNGWESLWLRFS